MPIDDNEPQRRRRPEGENQPSRPTQDRPNAPRFNPQFPSDANLPAGPNDQPRQPRRDDNEPARAPDLNRATGDETRRSFRGGDFNPQMRDMLNRLDRLDQPGDISDEEARRLAGLDNDQGEPRPVNPENLPAITGQEVARISNEIAAAGTVHPKWHSIRNLPGFQNRKVRGMGQDLFSMFTTTEHHNILTISTRANSEREVKAVLAWLQKNAESLPEVDIDYSGYNIGDYRPKVREFRTENTRFHVVQDPEGWYIYAYPEQTAVEHTSQSRLGHDGDDSGSDEPERDEFGALIPKRLKEDTQMKFSSISEQIRYLTNKLDNLEETALVDDIFKSQLAEAILDESTLAKLLGTTPGAGQLVRALHSRHKLASGGLKNRPGSANIDPDYEEIPPDTKNIAVTIKSNKDNFCIIVGTKGVAGVKPEEKRWDQSRSKERDTTLPYVVVWSTGEGAESEIAKYRMGRMDATGGSSAMEGGAPNLFQVLRDRIGPVVRAYRATGAVERTKMSGREKLKQSAVPSMEQVADKLKPVLAKLLQQTVGQLGPRIQRLAQAGNYDAVEKLTRAGKKIQAMATALDSDNPQWTGWNSPLSSYSSLVQSGVREITQGMDEDGRNQFMINIVNGQAKELGELLNFVRARLFSISE